MTATPELETPSGTRYARYVLVILLVVYSFNWMDRYVLVILFEEIKRDLKLSDTALGLLSGSAFIFVYSFAGIPIARWADMGTRRSIIALGVTVWSVMTAASGLARSVPQLVAARFGVALGESACSPPASSLISDYFPERHRATAFAVYGTGISIGIALGLIVGGWANEFYGWRVALMIAGCPGLLLALIIRLTVREPVRGLADRTAVDSTVYSVAATSRVVLSRRSFIPYAVGLGLFSIPLNALQTWTPVYLMREYHMGTGIIGTWTGLIQGIGGIVGTLAGGFLADRLGSRDVRWYLWMPAAAAAAMIPAMFVFLHTNKSVMFVFYFLTIACGASELAPIVAITQRVMPVHTRATATALLYLLINLIGPGSAPVIVGFLNDLFAANHGPEGVRLSLTVTLLAATCGVALTLYAARHLSADLALVHAGDQASGLTHRPTPG